MLAEALAHLTCVMDDSARYIEQHKCVSRGQGVRCVHSRQLQLLYQTWHLAVQAQALAAAFICAG